MTKDDLVRLWSDTQSILSRTESDVNDVCLSRLMTHLQAVSNAVIYRIASDMFIMSDFTTYSTEFMTIAIKQTSTWRELDAHPG